jgi:hypothetical protein
MMKFILALLLGMALAGGKIILPRCLFASGSLEPEAVEMASVDR